MPESTSTRGVFLSYAREDTDAALNARICDHAGDKDKALSEYARLIRMPVAAGFLNVYEIKRDTRSTLHGDPRFEALPNDPANNAPVF
jgi:hypothetical protein